MVRFTRHFPCPVCGGYDTLARGYGLRCHGFLSANGEYAHCSREEHACGLRLNAGSQAYAHRMIGVCNCGMTHGGTLHE
jgi:hypothetical protein